MIQRHSWSWLAAISFFLPALCQEASQHTKSSPTPGNMQRAVAAGKSFVLAFEGESFLFTPDANVFRAPFVTNVHRPFGFSNDGRYFLYLKSNGRFPTFELCVRDLLHGDETIIAPRTFFASWSPITHTVAFMSTSPTGDVTLSVHDLHSRVTRNVTSGLLVPDYVEWSRDGTQVRVIVQSPLTDNYFHDQLFSYTLWTYNTSTRSITSGEENEKASTTAQFLPSPLKFRSAQALTDGGIIRSITTGREYRYATVQEQGNVLVKRIDSETGALQTIDAGDVYVMTDDGVVIREFTANGVVYKYFQHNSAQITTRAAFNGTWKLPFAGSAYLVQGGGSYTPSTCDGRRCLVVAHNNLLGYALDWQQTTEEGQGDRRILAPADGTVVSVVNNVTCTSSSGCVTGVDTYSPTCNTNGGFGNTVVLAHADGSYSLYAHLRSGSIPVVPGQTVLQGQVIAMQGNSGSAGSPTNYHQCGEHLHFQRQTSPVPSGQSIPTDFQELPCTLTCMTTYISQNAEPQVAAASSLTLNLVPSTINSGTITTTFGNRVVLDSVAGAGGADVTISSSDPSLASTPATVHVNPGNVTAVFPVTTNPNLVSIPVTISASIGTATTGATLTLTPPSLSWLQHATSRTGGGSVIAGNELMLTGPAPAGGADVSLISSDPSIASVPGSVSIPPGETYATFSITTFPVSVTTRVTITASYGGATRSRSYNIDPIVPFSVNLSPSTILGGGVTSNNRVTLNAPAPTGGITVALSSSDQAVALPDATVFVPEGLTSSDTFTITTFPVVTSTQVTISATYNGTTKTRVLTVNPIALSALTLSPNITVGGTPTTANRVTLNAPAPTGGAAVTLSSSNSAAVPPATVLVPEGTTSSPTFSITTSPVSLTSAVTITASYGGVTKTAALTVNPSGLDSVVLGASSAGAGTSVASNRVVLDGPAPVGGLTVNLTSSHPAIAAVPANVTVPEGSTTSADFTITTTSGSPLTTVTISAALGAIVRTATLTVQPLGIASVAVSPSTILGGNSTTANTITLSVPAPGGGATVNLTSSNPTVASVPASVTIAAGSTVSPPFSITTTPVATPTSVVVTASWGTSSATASVTVNPLAAASVTLSPVSAIAGTSSNGVVALTGPAPAGGALVMLTSSDPAVASVPSSVTVPAGSSTSPSFPITAGGVTASTSVDINASYGGVTVSSVFTVNPTSLSSLTINPKQVGGGQPTTQNSVRITHPAPVGGALVTLTSSDPAVASPPAIVTVPEGATQSASFVITTTAVSASTAVTISATAGGVTLSRVLTVNPTAVAALTLNPSSVVGGGSTTQNKVTLDSPPPPGGATVTLTSSDPAVASPPPSTFLPEGNRVGPNFTITTAPVMVSTQVTISASYGGATKSSILIVDPIGLVSVDLNPTSIAGGSSSSSNIVRLNAPAPAGGAIVSLTSSHPAIASVPASVTVPAGATDSPGFTITSSPTSSNITVTISASYNGTTRNATLTVGGLTLSGLALAVGSIGGGSTVTGNTVTLNGPAPAGGAVATLTSSNPAVASVPSSVTIPDGASTATFNLVTSSVATATPVTISASYGGVTQTDSITVSPLTIVTLFLNPKTFAGGKTTTDNYVVLSGAAPPGGAVVSLTSSNPMLASVPASVMIAAGSTTSPRFNIVTTSTSSSTTVNIVASYGSSTLSRPLTINPVRVAQLILSPTSVVGGNSTFASKVVLDGPAPVGGAAVSLVSTNPAIASVPASVTVQEGSLMANFPIVTTPVVADTPVSISATLGGVTKTSVLTVKP